MAKTFLDNKKGNAIFDTLTVGIVLFIFAIVAVVGYMILSQLNAPMQIATNSSVTANNIWNNSLTKYPKIFDNLALFVFIGLWVSGIIASFMIDSHPIFAALTFILLIFVFSVSVILANTYDDLINSNNALYVAAGEFAKTNFLMQHMLLLMIVVGVSITIVLYGKSR